ncbi:ATP-dependent DNA helicase DDM1 [Galendromus occidentalis]|uniref:ATP-dependent DNA helicase DDM1 n=1 Tax=Galendromus occidentalis TaxID=34638 RepID=A0AAJ7L5T4_9ACAR|nr:ATP-dependent DNA helicase DDM1 [Galendromus occidentalis]
MDVGTIDATPDCNGFFSTRQTPREHHILKGRALAAKLRTAREDGILIDKDTRERLLSDADAESAKAFKDLCSLFDESLEVSTRVATSLEGKRTSGSKKDQLDEAPNLSLFSGGVLRDYQKEGAAWLVKLGKQGLNGILADEMGLGKTAQSIAMICHLVASGASGPFLILCPLSTVRNWENEFNRFSPALPVLVLHGPKTKRATIRRKLRIRRELGNGSEKSIFPVVIAPYHSFVADSKSLSRLKWSYLVLDEAAVIKNCETRLYKSVSSLYVTGKLLLTGTPLQNNIRELFNLLHFILPNIFHNYRLFEGWLEELDAHREEGSFGDGDSCQLVSTMHSILAPFFLRRTKESVRLDLPPKKHIIVYCPMTRLQQSYYKAVLFAKEKARKEDEALIIEDGAQSLRTCRLFNAFGEPSEKTRREMRIDPPAKPKKWFGGEDAESLSIYSRIGSSRVQSGARVPNESTDDAMRLLDKGRVKFSGATMNNILMALRKTVAHPWLLDLDKSWGGDYPRNRAALLEKSGKMQVFDILLRGLLEKNHKVLVFSGFTSVLDLISLYLALSKIEHYYLSGRTKLDERQELIDAFNKPNSVEKVFLLSTRAGGLGINLTGADTVIFYDTDWNPQMDLQAADRCHRIGQSQRVVIYRLITKESVDERILDVATNKRRLEKLVMKCGRFEKVTTIRDLKERDLLEVLKSVDWDAALDGDLLDPSRILALTDRDSVFSSEENNI